MSDTELQIPPGERPATMESLLAESRIADPKLAEEGRMRIEWSAQQMPVLARIRRRFTEDLPLAGVRIAACLHVTSETAIMVRTLKAAGADVVLCASNPLSTQDDVAASLVEDFQVPVFARRGEDRETYYEHLRSVLRICPHLVIDDGADLIAMLHKERPDLLPELRGGTEETGTGAVRLRSMERQSALRMPVIAVDDSITKHMFDNRYGTGQSTLDGILRATNVLLAGKTLVVIGYGWCGRGVASRAVGLGAEVVVAEIDPIRALEARLDGHRVQSIAETLSYADIFVTVTGSKHVIGKRHFNAMKDGAIVCNAGHFDVELDLEGLAELARSRRRLRPAVEEYKLLNGHRIHVLGEGRLINLTAAEGHPASVMDLSFANQALAGEYLVNAESRLEAGVHRIPDDLERAVARLKLKALGATLESETPEQQEYRESWEEGT